MAESITEKHKENSRNKEHLELLSLEPSTLLGAQSISVHHPAPIRITQENYESVVFVWLDPQDQSALNLVGQFRVINDQTKVFPNSTSCIKAIKYSKEKIFFITSYIDIELITTVHNLSAVEAIFIFASNVESIKGNFPKLCGIFSQSEELFRALKETLDVFEQIQLESFAFQEDKTFLWSQLWKEEVCKKKIYTFIFYAKKKRIFIFNINNFS